MVRNEVCAGCAPIRCESRCGAGTSGDERPAVKLQPNCDSARLALVNLGRNRAALRASWFLPEISLADCHKPAGSLVSGSSLKP